MGKEAIGQGDVGFGLLLRAHRGAAGLTQDELAARAGLSTEAISTLERGRYSPSLAVVERLARALGLRVSDRPDCRPADMVSQSDSLAFRCVLTTT